MGKITGGSNASKKAFDPLAIKSNIQRKPKKESKPMQLWLTFIGDDLPTDPTVKPGRLVDSTSPELGRRKTKVNMALAKVGWWIKMSDSDRNDYAPKITDASFVETALGLQPRVETFLLMPEETQEEYFGGLMQPDNAAVFAHAVQNSSDIRLELAIKILWRDHRISHLFRVIDSADEDRREFIFKRCNEAQLKAVAENTNSPAMLDELFKHCTVSKRAKRRVFEAMPEKKQHEYLGDLLNVQDSSKLYDAYQSMPTYRIFLAKRAFWHPQRLNGMSFAEIMQMISAEKQHRKAEVEDLTTFMDKLTVVKSEIQSEKFSATLENDTVEAETLEDMLQKLSIANT